MTAKQLKGALLEFIIKELLMNCGFKPVIPDGNYVYKQEGSGLLYINGKGAAHDADVLMSPPMQLPFSYPSRLLFECKAYERKVGLDVMRGALGLQYDINEFEIVTEQSITKRKNNRRATYSISNRDRYNYQVGVASVHEFSKPAFEYAANNKLPLLSTSWVFSEDINNLFDSITNEYLNGLPTGMGRLLYDYFKSRDRVSFSALPVELQLFIDDDNVIGMIVHAVFNLLGESLVGLNEFGDLFFLFGAEATFLLTESPDTNVYKARIHYWPDEPNTWYLNIGRDGFASEDRNRHFKFHLPERLMNEWAESSHDRVEALKIKERFFSRIYIFGATTAEAPIPFRILEIDQPWLRGLRGR